MKMNFITVCFEKLAISY